MDNKLYVGNLSYSTTEDDLHTLFSDAGSVQSVAVIKDRDSGRSKGFGFVEMSSDDDAQKAIDLLHGTDYQGRPLTVNVARPREDRPRFDGGGGGGNKGRRSGGGGGRQRDW
ncbi:RNA-binding protein [Desulfonatronum sp. SC1]|uniref:RNA recognition motif domain-containing protein n=1 Tax=Desulfonatronum sp. SC1 TaxID=2109626 RepID=UPI000D31FFA6|nr:RNA-binding protein [Desulfonatronum sp. SC1]PTN33938.1 RNA-binding protein [Desulfonatronum sp. SC1]